MIPARMVSNSYSRRSGGDGGVDGAARSRIRVASTLSVSYQSALIPTLAEFSNKCHPMRLQWRKAEGVCWRR